MNITRLSFLGVLISFTATAVNSQESWSVTKGKNEMDGVPVVTACAIALNSVQQDFPYNKGRTRAKLCLQKQGKEIGVFVRISAGQLQCDLRNETLRLKIDGNVAKEYECTGSQSNRTDIGFFENEDKAFNEILSANELIRIELNIYNYGSAVYRFKPIGKKLPREFEKD